MNKSREKKGIRQIRIPNRCGLALIAFLLCAFTARVSAQEQPVSLNLKNVALEQVLNGIEKQTDYLFVYGDNVDVAQTVSITAEAKPLKLVLHELLSAIGIQYTINGTSISLTPAHKSNAGSARKVSGTVTSDNGLPVIGASVMIKGTTIGTTSGMEGRFTLEVPAESANSTLVVSFMGYDPVELPIDDRSSFPVVLKETNLQIEQVVVTALGIKRSEKALSYNVQTVSSDDLTTVKDANFVNSLNGKVAGLNINTSAGGVGAASKVVMRGIRSISKSSNAFYVIDGVPMNNPVNQSNEVSAAPFESSGSTDMVADLNPEDIESISVLTGAAAAALYGSTAANGVIIINTRKGTEGKTSFTVTHGTDFITPFAAPQFQNRYGTSLDPEQRNRSWGPLLNHFNYTGFDPLKDYMQTGVTHTETVALSTGNSRNQTYMSVGRVDSEGSIPNSKYDRYNFTFRNTTSLLKDKMTLNAGAGYVRQRDLNMVSQGVYSNPLVSAYLYPRSNNWESVKMFEHWDMQRKISLPFWDMDAGAYVLQNPYWINYRNLRENKKDRYMFNASVDYQVLDWLKFSARANADNTVERGTRKYWAGTNTQLTEGSTNGLYGESLYEDRQMYADFMAHVNHTWGDGLLSFNATVGTSIWDLQHDERRIYGPIRDGSIKDEPFLPSNVFVLWQISNTQTKHVLSTYREQMQSVFASAEVGIRNTFFVTGTVRTDWPSQLAGPESVNRSFTYPSVGVSTVLSQLIPMPKAINYLKIRGSYADVGLAFPRFLAFNDLRDMRDDNWAKPTSANVNDLKPEYTHSYEAGLTAKFFRHFDLDVTVYKTNTVNQLIRLDASPTSKYQYIYRQMGDVQNEGIEASLGYGNQWNRFGWKTNIVFSANRNRVLKLTDNYIDERGNPVSYSLLSMGGIGSSLKFLIREGGTLGDLYAPMDMLRDNNGNIYIDQNGKVYRNSVTKPFDDWTKLGSIFPKANLGWRNDFTIGRLSLSALITARLGGVVYSRTQAALDYHGVSKATADARDNGGVVINGGDVVDAYNWYDVVGMDDGVPLYYTYDATNVRLQEASIGYAIPRKWLGNVCDVNVSIVGRNLWMIYNKAPFDPESTASVNDNYYQGIDYFMMPSMRTMGFNVRVKF